MSITMASILNHALIHLEGMILRIPVPMFQISAYIILPFAEIPQTPGHVSNFSKLVHIEQRLCSLTQHGVTYGSTRNLSWELGQVLWSWHPSVLVPEVKNPVTFPRTLQRTKIYSMSEYFCTI